MKQMMCVAMVGMALVGCATKSVNVEGKGMYANSTSGIVGIGQFEVNSIPDSTESAQVKYIEDTAWLSPSTKTRDISIFLTGTNAVSSAEGIVKSICDAFIAAETNGNFSVDR